MHDKTYHCLYCHRDKKEEDMFRMHQDGKPAKCISCHEKAKQFREKRRRELSERSQDFLSEKFK